jgi:uncharacterized membrane protein
MTSNYSLLAVVNIAVRVLNHRLMALLTLMMTFALFCWAMYLGDWLRFSVAGAFGFTIFLPVLWKGENRDENSQAAE